MAFAQLVAEAYPVEKRVEERRNNPASYFVYRPCSWPVTALCLAANCGPVQVTAVALAIAIFGLAALASGSVVLGLIALNVSCMLDQVDGNVARAKGKASHRGAWLDGLVGYLYSTFTLLFASIGAAPIPGWPHGESLVVLGAIATMAIALRKHSVVTSASYCQEVSRGFKRQSGVAYVIKAVNSFSLLILLVGALCGILVVLVAMFAVYHAFTVCAVVTITYRKLGQ